MYFRIKNEGVSHNDLRERIQDEITQFLKKHTVNFVTNVSSTPNIIQDIIMQCFKSDELFSGNLDARKIREIANKYGFSCSIGAITLEDGTIQNFNRDHILTVKSRRNELAHGDYSFKDCGSNYTLQELMEIKIHVISYLRQVLEHIENYINDRKYLENR